MMYGSLRSRSRLVTVLTSLWTVNSQFFRSLRRLLYLSPKYFSHALGSEFVLILKCPRFSPDATGKNTRVVEKKKLDQDVSRTVGRSALASVIRTPADPHRLVVLQPLSDELLKLYAVPDGTRG